MNRRPAFALLLPLALGLACSRPAPDPYPVVPGPVASPELTARLAERDRLLFELVFEREDEAALGDLLCEDFQFVHDKWGLVAQSREAFVEKIRQGFAEQRAGRDGRARRELVPGSMKVYPIAASGAIQTGRHRFYGLEPGKPDALRESGQFFHVWRLENGTWRLARVYSFDHHPGA